MPPRKSTSTKYDANILLSAFCMDKAKQIMVQRPYGDLKLSQKDITDMRRKLTSEISKTVAGEKRLRNQQLKNRLQQRNQQLEKTTKKTTEKKPRGRKARPNRVAKLVMPPKETPPPEPIAEIVSEPISQPVVDIP